MDGFSKSLHDMDIRTAYIRGFSDGRTDGRETADIPIYILHRNESPDGWRAKMFKRLRDLFTDLQEPLYEKVK